MKESKAKSRRSGKDHSALNSLSVIDDIMFRQMAKDTGFMQEVIRTTLGDPLLEVLESKPQVAIDPFRKRSIIVDCLCRTGD